MGIYHKHMTQRVPSDPHWRVNCTAYCGAMLINDATLGGLTGITGRWVREHSNEPNPSPGSPGLNIPQIIAVARGLHVKIEDMTGRSWGDMIGRLQAGHRILLQIDYGELPETEKCQAGGDFGHAVVLFQDSGPGRVRGSDPLCGAPRDYTETRMQDAARKLARDTGVQQGLRWCMTRPVPLLK